MRLWCWPFRHNYRCINVVNFNDISLVSDGISDWPRTNATYVCQTCGKVKHKTYEGYLSIEHLNIGEVNNGPTK